MKRDVGMELNKKNMKRIMLLIAFGIAFYLGLKNLPSIQGVFNYIILIFLPLLLGVAFAFILNVLMRQVEKIFFAPINKRCTKTWPKIRRPISILVTVLIVIGIAALIVLIFVPEIIRTVTSLVGNIPQFVDNVKAEMEHIKKAYPLIGNYLGNININWSNISDMAYQFGQKFASTLVNSTVVAATNIVRTVLSVVLGFIFAINILAVKENLKSQLKRVMYTYLPQKPTDKFLRVCDLANHAFSNFIVGQCTEACILGTLCFIGMSIFRFPYALLISILVAFNAFIPVFGSLLSILTGALLILVVSPMQSFWFIIFFVVLQQIEGNFIYPRVVGSKIGLPALWVLAAITVGGNMFGIVGMILSIPLSSVLYTILREDVKKQNGVARRYKL